MKSSIMALNTNFIVAMIVVLVFILLMIFTRIFISIKYKRYKRAKQNNDSLETLFELESELKNSKERGAVIVCYPIPYVLLMACTYGLINAIKGGTENFNFIYIIILSIPELFLLFLCVLMTILPILNIKQKKKKKTKSIQGTLKSIVLSTIKQFSNNVETLDYFHLVITYQLDGQDYEFRTNETYSQTQIDFLKKLSYIPLLKIENSIEVDYDKVLKMQEFALNQVDVKLERGVVSLFGATKINQVDTSNSGTKKIVETTSSIESRGSQHKGYSKIESVLIIIFILLFTTPFVVGLFYDKSLLLIICTIIIGLGDIFILYLRLIKPIAEKKLYKKILALGHCSFATKYKVNVSRKTTEDYAGITFYFIDDYGKERCKGELSKVSRSFFKVYSIQKLPIIVWKNHATIDYATLLKYQNMET